MLKGCKKSVCIAILFTDQSAACMLGENHAV